MRPTFASRAVGATLALCALACTLPAAVSPAAAQAGGAGAAITVHLTDPTPAYGRPVLITGRARGVGTGATVTVQHRAVGDGAWTAVATARTRARGAYRVSAVLTRRGALRAVLGDGTPAVRASTGGAAVLTASAPVPAPVHAGVTLRRMDRALSPGDHVVARGHVQPGGRGRIVALERRSGRRWVAIARDRTDHTGAYRLRARMTAGGALRVRVVGDARLMGTVRSAGRVDTMRSALASWYGDYGGPLACGGTLGASQMGVAHKTLPCGTMVTISYRGRTVRVPVIDRGPYVGGREFDLTGATAHALHFDGVGVIQVSTR